MTDEYGATWVVKPGDPANGHKNRLAGLGFEIIVLPRKTYLTGEVVSPDFLPGDIVSRVRIQDCLGVLWTK